MAYRQDTFRIDRVERVPGSAGLRVPAELTRSGVFTYRDDSGRAFNEWRPASEVLAPASLATYEDAHVTIGHPPGGVNGANYREVSVGHVRGDVRADAASGKVLGSLFVGRGDAIGRVDSKDLIETSAGYDIDLDETPGVVPAGEPGAGTKYDRVQRNIRVNHVALLRRGDSRLGTVLRLDSAGNQIADDGPCTSPQPGSPLTHPTEPPMKIKIGTKELEVRADHLADDLAAVTVAHNEAVLAALTPVAAERDTYKARSDAADREKAERDAKARADARAALEAKAKAAGVTELSRKDAAGAAVALTDRELKVAVIQRKDSAFKAEGQSDAYVDAMFDISTRADAAVTAPAATLAQSPAAPLLQTLAGARSDANTAQADGGRGDLMQDPRAYAMRADAFAANLATARR